MADFFSWVDKPLDTHAVLNMIIGAVVILAFILGVVTYSIYFQRKLIGWMQWRIGPNRVGPLGLLQTIADVLKLLIKEDVVPEKADRNIFLIAPILAFFPSFMVLAVIPFSANHVFTAYSNVGVLYYIALSAMTIIGVVLGGWASNNKYSLIGGMRSAAQMISYEVPLAMSILGVVLMAGSMNLVNIVEAQISFPYVWYIVPQFLGFCVFIISATAELSRTPFDLPEAESELVSGYNTEYSGFRFAFFYLAEYVYLFAMSGLGATLYFGGWSGPFLPGWIWFGIKVTCFIFFFFWLQATMPRIRTDQLLTFAWKVLIPLSIVNLVLTAVLKYLLH
ncbi:NADH-quinone oxidoreductase subunit NuoH [Tumebacillus flagellatus]|uniref:NADH-quinone oxidoreductase subunit H n=1 Tax=Tumebacillus flagellatus TaxID=1157490 RepID=A0A074MBN4_9BACL|nr:NADH-quinone oxidoreductase subunit NuoH [Tumebacillus flagellatus]KEO83332.1 NADH:ubiquinone oxidoreductase subunit H [Tumebacillus flagellatus]